MRDAKHDACYVRRDVPNREVLDFEDYGSRYGFPPPNHRPSQLDSELLFSVDVRVKVSDLLPREAVFLGVPCADLRNLNQQ